MYPSRRGDFWFFAVFFASLSASGWVRAEDPVSTVVKPAALAGLLSQHCADCHTGEVPSAEFDITPLLTSDLKQHTGSWEKVIRKLQTRQMPPAGADRPSENEYLEATTFLEQALDQIALTAPQPGRTSTFRRLTRTEYQHSIRDLLGIEVDIEALLPADEVSQGFDNITVGELSPTLLNRYISAAQYISRVALARPLKTPDGQTFRVAPDVTQEAHVAGLPLGTRGGMLVRYNFPADGRYEIRVRLARDRNEHVEGLNEPHQLEVLLDSATIDSFTVRPPRGAASSANDPYNRPTHENIDQHLVTSFQVSAGEHELGVTFIKNPSSLLETERQPLNVHYNMYRHPRLSPAIYQISVTGPMEADAAANNSTQPLSRQKIFVCYPQDSSDEQACAEQIIANLLRRAGRRPVSSEDLVRPLELYRQGRENGTFEDGIEMALSSILVHPRFLFRIESDPPHVGPQQAYRISDVELASRLSFFLWSSVPDEELLALAEQGTLSQPEILTAQTRRMLADSRASALVDNFAGQWLYLRNLDSITPDFRLYPDFDDNLRQAFRTETEMFFESIVREDRSVLDLLQADYTFLNERLAKHYGIPHVYGSRFRRVELEPGSQRGGLLRHGSVLTVTSYATRTSPVLRGKWILENVLGTPPPPPPANVPALSDNIISAKLPVRERLAQHRADAACASCHNLIDPPGFALENFDAVGRWRDLEEGHVVDASGGLPDGSEFNGVDGLEHGLLQRPELFVTTLTEKLLIYALGRGLEPSDAPAVRRMVRAAEQQKFRFSALILGIVHSTPFQMRSSP